MNRRELLLAAGTAVGVEALTAPAKATAAGRIDAHTHFMPLKYLDFAEKVEGGSFNAAVC